jgi:hypothetical protein
MVTVLPETRGDVGGYVIVAVGEAVKTMTVEVTVVVAAGVAPGAGVGAGVAWDGNGGKIWLHPLASRNTTAAIPRITMYFITEFSSQIIRRSGAIKMIRGGNGPHGPFAAGYSSASGPGSSAGRIVTGICARI